MTLHIVNRNKWAWIFTAKNSYVHFEAIPLGLIFIDSLAVMFMLNKLQQIISRELNTNGFNVRINVDNEARQTAPHVYIHLISQFSGDVKEP